MNTKPYEYDVFISYSYADRHFADTLLSELEKRGLRVAIDHQVFRIGSPVIVEMDRAINESKS